MKIGFDNERYVQLQSKEIKERIKLFNNKLYLEVGGKLVDDHHAKRVLPGYDLKAKIKILTELKDISEVIFCINAEDIEKNKMNSNLGITYDMDLLRLIDYLRKLKISINSVVITLFKGQPAALAFQKKLENNNIKTYFHTYTKGYPTEVDVIVSEEGYGANPYIPTTKPLIVVTAPGPGSGKLGTCLSQLYHEHKHGIKAGYAKFETFPVWDLPLKHPVNMAYEAATAELNDRNMIDAFHLETYQIAAVNYNRDLEVFPVLREILYKIMKKNVYNSPTDMGVNTIGSCIIDDDVVKSSARQEILRRYYKALCDKKMGNGSEEICQRIKLLLNELEIDEKERPVIEAARKKASEKKAPAIAIQMPDNSIITGRQTNLLTAPSSLILNCMKKMTNISDDMDLLSPSVLEPIAMLKKNQANKLLSLQEVLIALSICSATNPVIMKAINKLEKLEELEAHATYIVQNGDLKSLRSLNINLTCESVFNSDHLFEE